MSFTGTNLPSLLLIIVGIICLLGGLRAIQLGQRTTYFRHRRDRVVAGWWLIGSAVLLVVIGVNVYSPGKPLTLPAEATSTRVASPVPPTATRTPSPAPISSSPRAVSGTETATSVPVIPLSIQVLALSTVTPRASASITEINFSPELDGQLAQNPKTEWLNPIRRMYATFVYRDMTPGVQWTVLWLRDGAMVAFESHPWNGGERGRGFSLWEPAQSYDMLPGEYEVQFYIGSTWVASGRFTLTGRPAGPTATLTPRPTRNPSQTPVPTRTPPNTPTRTPIPSSTPLPTHTFTPTITLTPTLTFTPTNTRTPIYTALPTNTPLYQRVTVYFVDIARLNAGLIPPEVGVPRYAVSTSDPLRLVLDAYFNGPGLVEQQNGLTNILNGFTGYNKLVIDNGILHVYLTGSCEFSTSDYSIAQTLIVNLGQFSEVRALKIYDQNGLTREPEGRSNSAPACLGFSSMLNPTRTPTVTPKP